MLFTSSVNKGDHTRSTILVEALSLASTEGLEALSIGRLAKLAGLSKSGLFAHFKSKETLQIQVLEQAAELFKGAVIFPALKRPRGLPRVEAVWDLWMQWAQSERIPGGCVFLSAATDYDDRPGPLRDYIVQTQGEWTQFLTRAAQIAVDEGHFRSDLDTSRFAYSMYSLIMGYHFYKRLLSDEDAGPRARAAFKQLLDDAARRH